MKGPGKLNFTVQRRAGYAFGINLKDSNNANVNLTGKTILSQIWDESRTNKVADVTTTITDATGGDVSWKLSHTQTANMTDAIYNYDVIKIHANGDREYFLEGIIYMSEGYTAS